MLPRMLRLTDDGPVSSSKRGTGQALVELVLVLPVLLILTFGVWEFGRVLDAWVIVTNASREGARVAALGASADEVRQRVDDYLTLGYGARIGKDIVFDASKIQVAGVGSPKGDPVTVRVPAQVRIYTPVFANVADPLGIVGQTTMRLE